MFGLSRAARAMPSAAVPAVATQVRPSTVSNAADSISANDR
jgi:hypothetical protein